MKRGILVTCALASSMLMLGCGPGGPATVPVTGKITKGGQGVANVTVTLIDAKNPNHTSSGSSDSNGEFTMVYGTQGKKGAVPGTYAVVLSGGETNSAMQKGADGKPSGYGGGGRGASSLAPVAQTPYDKKWTTAETSPMQTVEVKSGMPKLEINLDQ